MSSNIIYLYQKIHRKTGLKYLGQTSAKDPYSYPGSGTYWKLHLKKHGYDFDTIILRECKSKDELREWGIYYSNLWNIVDSDEWANLKIEQGDGGRQSAEVRERIGELGKGRTPWNKGKHGHLSEDQRRKISESGKGRKKTSEAIEKTRSKMLGRTQSDEARRKISESQKGREFSDNHRSKLSIAARNRNLESRQRPFDPSVAGSRSTQWEIMTDDGSRTTVTGLKKWCRDNGIDYGRLHYAITKNQSFEGMTVKRL